MRYLRFLLIALLPLLFSCSDSINQSKSIGTLNAGWLTVDRNVIDKTPIIELEGDAGFYYGEFVDPSMPPPMSEFTEVSESWGGLYPAQGDGTIRFLIKKDPLIDTLSISFDTIYSSYRMYINGQLVSSSGKPSLEKGRRQLRIKRSEVIFYSKGAQTLDIVFHISNPSYSRNGIKRLKIGTTEALLADYYWSLFFDCFKWGILFALTLYHFILVFSRTDKSFLLFFALLTLSITFRYFVVNTKLVLDVFPTLSFTTWDRIQRLGIYPVAGLFITYIHHLYRDISNKKLVWGIQIASIGYTILSFMVPPTLIGTLYKAFYPVIIVVLIYGFYLIGKAVVRKLEDSYYTAVGVLILLGTAVFDILVDRDIISPFAYYHLEEGMIVFLILQAFVISRRINRAYVNERRFREALQGMQSRLNLTLEGAELGLIEWDILHNTWYMNDNFSSMIGFKKDHQLFNRRHWIELIHPDEVKEINALLKEALTGHIDNFRREYRIKNSEGHYRWCLLLGKVIQQNKLGGAEWFVGLHIDINDKKRSEEALTQIIHADKGNLEKARDEAELILLRGVEEDGLG